MRTSRHIDRLILEAAARRESVVHAHDLRRLEIPPGTTRRRVASAFMAPIEPRTYGVGPDATAPTYRMLCMSAVLHAGDGSRLDGTTAAKLRGLWDRGDDSIHVVAPRNVRQSTNPAITYHRAPPTWRSARPLDQGALPIVGFLDLCVRASQQLTKWQLAAIIARGIYQRLVTLAELVGASVARGSAPGSVTLREAIELIAAGSVGTRSSTEDAVLADLLAAGVPEPLVNVRGCMGLYRDEPDMVWGERRRNLEIDGPQHDEPAQAADDARRDADVRRDGWEVMRLRARAYWNDRRGSIRRVLRFLRT